MKCIMSPFNRCFLNIASEEYYLNCFDDDIFYLYINAPCVIIGRHQNAYAEVNHDYVKKSGIEVVRRNSGGGAVYHDFGNLNYGFITKSGGADARDVFLEFTKPILRILNDLGARAVFSGRNDLLIDGKKFSGNALYYFKNKVLIHGTLLFSSDLEQVSKSLNADPRKFEGKGVKSVRSRVTNILPHLTAPKTIDEFSSIIMEEITGEFSGARMYELTKGDCERIEALSDKKYSTWEWNYGNSPDFNCRNTLKYDLGLIDIGVKAEAGTIKEIAVYGDFFGKKDLDEVLLSLKGLKFDEAAVSKALDGVSIADYIFGLSNEAFLNCLFGGPQAAIS